MRLVDLTLPVPARENMRPTVHLDEWPLDYKGQPYTGMVYHFDHWSMSGTYLDIPGHIKELGDGFDSANYPLEKLYEVDAAVIHLDRSEKAGKVHARELAVASEIDGKVGAIILHALGPKRFDEAPERSVALATDAVEWMIGKGIHLLVSDIYEHCDKPENIFWTLFEAGISTVCCPINLGLLDRPKAKLTVLAPRFPGVTQLPCRVVAGVE